MKIKKIILFASPRSGSNLLVNILGQCPEITFHNEVFHPSEPQIALPEHLRKKWHDYDKRISFHKEYISDVVKQSYRLNKQIKYVGFKILLSPPQLKIFEQFINDDDIYWISLNRDNKLQMFTSQEIAVETKEWIMPQGTKIYEDLRTGFWNKFNNSNRKQHQIKFDGDKFRGYLNRLKELEEHYKLVEAQKNVLKLEYLEVRSEQVVEILSNFLNLDEWNYGHKIKKQNSENVLDRVSNKFSMIKFLVANGYYSYLK